MNKKFFLASNAQLTPPGGVTPPAFATSFGFNQVALFDHFDSISTIDIGATNAPGFNWYLFPGQSSSRVTVANSILTITNPGGQGLLLKGAANLGGFGAGKLNSGTVGKLIPGSDGYYAEARIRFNPAGQPDFAIAFWLADMLAWDFGQVAGQPIASGHPEVDILENLAPPARAHQAYLSWDTNGSVTQFQTAEPPNAGIYSGIDYSQYHLWGVLYVPPAKNGGTGLIRFYVDRSQFFSDITWSPGDPIKSVIEVSTAYPIFQNDFPMDCDYVGVWNSGPTWNGPSANLTHRWPMNDARVVGTQVRDVIGSLHGTAGSGISSVIGPRCDQARLSNGVTGQGYITLSSTPIASLAGAWSLAGWLKMTTLPNGANLTLAQLDDTTNQLRFVIDRTTNPGALCLTKNGSVSQFSTGAPMYGAGVYTHAVVTYDGAGTYAVWRNAIQVALGGSAQVANPSTGNCLLGQSAAAANGVNAAGGQWVTYNAKLTQAQIIQLYNSYEPQ